MDRQKKRARALYNSVFGIIYVKVGALTDWGRERWLFIIVSFASFILKVGAWTDRRTGLWICIIVTLASFILFSVHALNLY